MFRVLPWERLLLVLCCWDTMRGSLLEPTMTSNTHEGAREVMPWPLALACALSVFLFSRRRVPATKSRVLRYIPRDRLGNTSDPFSKLVKLNQTHFTRYTYVEGLKPKPACNRPFAGRQTQTRVVFSYRTRPLYWSQHHAAQSRLLRRAMSYLHFNTIYGACHKTNRVGWRTEPGQTPAGGDAGWHILPMRGEIATTFMAARRSNTARRWTDSEVGPCSTQS